MKPLVAIVGRPNVGKSTLFNRIVGRRLAIVEDVPGVTRDRHYAEVEWVGKAFLLVDTGGFEPDTDDTLLAGMRQQAQLAVEEAQAIVLVVDAMEGVTAADVEVAAYLRRSGRPVIVAANKVDSMRRAEETSELAETHALGFEVFAISAEHGKGIGDLLDAVVAQVEAPADVEPPEADAEACRVAVLGRPNVGKSTLVNRLLGEDRFLATDVAGTTRDSIDATLKYRGRTFVLTDTAGIRRKRSITQALERYTVVRALKTVERSDVVVLVMDATEPVVAQEARLASMALEQGRGLVFALNKWDLVRGEEAAADALRQKVAEALPDMRHVPVVLLSALEGKRVFTLLETVSATCDELRRRVPTPELNRWLEAVTSERPPPIFKGKPVRLLYVRQVGESPPVFVLTVSRPEAISEAYKRFLLNRIRASFGFPGVPLRLSLRSRRPDRKPGR